MTAAMNVDWPDRLFDAFKRADIRQVGYVLIRRSARCR
jgi:hypothetical protein